MHARILMRCSDTNPSLCIYASCRVERQEARDFPAQWQIGRKVPHSEQINGFIKRRWEINYKRGALGCRVSSRWQR